MAVDSDFLRGNVDTIILKTLAERDKYGYEIIEEIEKKSNGTFELKQPTLYSCLKRLENQKLISSYWVNSDIGGRRHYYKLTEEGKTFFEKNLQDWLNSKLIIDNLIGVTSKNAQSNSEINSSEDISSANADGVKSFDNIDDQIDNENMQSDISSADYKEGENNQKLKISAYELTEINANDTNLNEKILSDSIADNLSQNNPQNNISEIIDQNISCQNEEQNEFNETDNEYHLSDEIEESYEEDEEDVDFQNSPTDSSFEKEYDENQENLNNEDDIIPDHNFNENGYTFDIETNENAEPIELIEEYYKVDENQYNMFSNRDADKNISENFLSSNNEIDNFSLDIENTESEFENAEETESDINEIDETIEEFNNNLENDDKLLREEEIKDEDEIDDISDLVYFEDLSNDKILNDTKNYENSLIDYEEEIKPQYLPNQDDETSSAEEQTNLFDSNINTKDDTYFNEKLNKIYDSANKFNTRYNSNSDLNINEAENTNFDLHTQNNANIENENLDNFNVEEYFNNSESYFNNIKSEDTVSSINNFETNSFGNIPNTNIFNIDNLNINNIHDNNFEYENELNGLEFDKNNSAQDIDFNDNDDEDDYKLNINYDDEDFENSYDEVNNEYNTETTYNDDDTEIHSDFSNNIQNSISNDFYKNNDYEDNSNDNFMPKIANEPQSFEEQKFYEKIDNYRSYSPKYTDKQYKDILHNITSYNNKTEKDETKRTEVPTVNNQGTSYQELKENFASEGINLRAYAKPQKEDSSTKSYILANKIKMHSSWMVCGIVSLLLLITYFIAKSAGYLSFAPNLTLVYFLGAQAINLILPIVYSIIFLYNPTKKQTPRYSAKSSFVFALLFFIQCLVLIYAINIPFGFSSFSQTDYNHLNWLLPSILSLIIIVSSLCYSALFKSKKYLV